MTIPYTFASSTSTIPLANLDSNFTYLNNRTIQTFWCERTSFGTATNVMSYGNGLAAGKGLLMPYSGKLLYATLIGYTVTGTITVQAYLNGTANSSYQLTATGTGGDARQVQDFSSSPLSFSAGDTLGWYQAAVPSAAIGYNVCYVIMYN